MKESHNWLRNVENVKEAKTVIHGNKVIGWRAVKQ